MNLASIADIGRANGALPEQRTVGPVEMWDAVCLAARGRADVQCTGGEDVFVPVEAGTHSAEDLKAFVAEIDRSARITSGGARYRIAYGYTVDADDGQGMATAVTELRREGLPVLLSMSRVHFAPGNDDSDTVTARESELHLVDPEDVMGAIVHSLLGQ